MKIIKIFSNNGVIVLTDDGQEAVAFGKGLGFAQKIGNIIEESKVEKLYLFQDDLQNKFLKLLNDIDEEYLFVTETIINKANKQGFNVQDKAVIAMVDHISFAVLRFKNNEMNVNIMLNELKMFYPEEYKIGLYGVELINRTFGVALPEDEAGYLALHIVQSANAQTPGNIKQVIAFVQHCTKMISQLYGITFIEDEFHYCRLVNHLKFFVGRMLDDKVIVFHQDPEMYTYFMNANPNNAKFVKQFKSYIMKEFSHKTTDSEILYVLIHITRFCKKNKEGGN